MALGLQIPECLVGLAQAGKNEAERLTIVIDETMPLYPSGYEFLLMLQACTKLLPPGVIIEPKVLAWDELPCECRCLDQLADQTARCPDSAVTDANVLVLSAAGTPLDVGNLDRAGSGVLKAVDRQPLAAFELQAGLQRQEGQKWWNIHCT